MPHAAHCCAACAAIIHRLTAAACAHGHGAHALASTAARKVVVDAQGPHPLKPLPQRGRMPRWRRLKAHRMQVCSRIVLLRLAWGDGQQQWWLLAVRCSSRGCRCDAEADRPAQIATLMM